MTNNCSYSPGDQHSLCKNKTCIFNKKKWILEKNLAKVTKNLTKCQSNIKLTEKGHKLHNKTYNELIKEESILLTGKMKFETKIKEVMK